MNNGIDDSLTEGNGIPVWTADTLARCDFVDDLVFHTLQTVENRLAGFDKTVKTIFLAVEQINAVVSSIFGHLDGIAVLVGEKVGNYSYRLLLRSAVPDWPQICRSGTIPPPDSRFSIVQRSALDVEPSSCQSSCVFVGQTCPQSS